MEISNTVKYKDVMMSVVKHGEGFNDIDPQMHQMFLSCISTFNDAIKEVYGEERQLQDNDIRLKVFERMFNIDIEAELSKMVEDIVTGKTDSDEDINNVKQVDEKLLANIKDNIKQYLKD